MEKYSHDSRIDHRSFERQGVEQIPTIHMGVAATQMEQRGIATDRGNINREIRASNNLLRQIWEKMKQLKDWLKQALTLTAQSTLYENIRQGGIYLEHRALYTEYQSLKLRKQSKFYEEYRTDLMLFESAQRYFRERHIGSDFSLAAWKEELEKLTDERGKVYQEYNVIKAQFSEVETIRLAAENIVSEVARNMNLTKKKSKQDSWNDKQTLLR